MAVNESGIEAYLPKGANAFDGRRAEAPLNERPYGRGVPKELVLLNGTPETADWRLDLGLPERSRGTDDPSPLSSSSSP